MAMFSGQSCNVVVSSLKSWEALCERDGLFESRTSFRDLERSFHEGLPSNKAEFFDENDQARTEWIKWIYNKL